MLLAMISGKAVVYICQFAVIYPLVIIDMDNLHWLWPVIALEYASWVLSQLIIWQVAMRYYEATRPIRLGIFRRANTGETDSTSPRHSRYESREDLSFSEYDQPNSRNNSNDM